MIEASNELINKDLFEEERRKVNEQAGRPPRSDGWKEGWKEQRAYETASASPWYLPFVVVTARLGQSNECQSTKLPW